MVLVATQVKRRRGTGAENDAFTGAEGEITVDLTNKELRVHTGDNKVGGYGLARKDFENLTNGAKNIANWSSNVSNCITNIPQDIELELNNGTLTLKAGSKVYVPNGVGVFDEVTIASDISFTETGYTDQYLCFINPGNTVDKELVSHCYSGSSAPSGQTYMNWYDTTNNLVKRTSDGGSTWTSGYSLPFCVVTTQAGIGITSIDQVFNGCGYIGSTIFALPNVKGLIPNGRNADGTLKNTIFTTSSVLTQTFSGGNRRQYCVALSSTSITSFSFKYGEPESGFVTYQEKENYNYASTTKFMSATIGWLDTSSGKVSLFKTNSLFHALDYNDTEYIAHQVMPSGRADSLTVGTAGTTYTAPADGWFNFVHQGSNGEWIMLTNSALGFEVDTVIYNQGFARIYMPCRKGDVIQINYSATGSYKRLNFYYAEGSK